MIVLAGHMMSHDMQPIPNYKAHARDPKIKEPK